MQVKKFIKSFIVLSLVFCTSSVSYATDSVDGLIKSLNVWAMSMQGVVSVVNGDKCALEFKNGAPVIINGMKFKSNKYGQELKNPITGASLGRKIIPLNDLVVSSSSKAEVIAGCVSTEAAKFETGDKFFIDEPIKIKVKFDGLSDSERGDILFAVLFDKYLTVSDESEYTLTCRKNKSDKRINCSIDFLGNVIFKKDLDVKDSIKVILKSKNKSITSNMQKFDERYISTSLGRVYGKDGGVTLALASENNITIFKYDVLTQTLKESLIINTNFDYIANIEIADLNGNGVDEIFVSNIKEGETADSYILEYNGKDFVVTSSELPYLFRSYSNAGNKIITVQKFADGDFGGHISRYTYDDNKYTLVAYPDKMFGTRLYGFGQIDLGIRGTYYTSFSNVGEFLISDPNGKKYQLKGEFGETPHSLIYTKKIEKDVKRIDDGSIMSVVDKRYIAYPVYERIIEIDSGKFVLSSNVPVEKKSRGETEFLSSTIGVYMALDDTMTEVVPIDNNVTPAIIESDIINIGDRYLLAVLIDKSSKLFGEGECGISFVEIMTKDVFEVK